MKAEDDKVLRRAALKAGKIVDKGRLGRDTMRDAARLEASALYEIEDTYNYPEEAMAKAFERGAEWQAAQSQPAPPVPDSLQEIMRLMMPYVDACAEFENETIPRLRRISEDEVAATFAPLQAALAALVDDNHRLKFELAGVRGTAETEPKCETCGGRGQVTQSERVGESDFNEWDIDCPVCDGAGHAPGALQKHVASLNARIDKLQREAYDWWAAANTSSGVNAMRRPAMEEHAARWMWARKNLLSAYFQSGKHNSGQTSITPIGEANTDWYWDKIADQFRGIEPEQGGNHG